MPKKKAAKTAPAIVTKLIKWPSDWVEKIDAVRGDVPFSEFVRSAVGEKIGTDDLSKIGSWGGERPR